MAWLLVGLGNPGPSYVNHRHNIGFMVIDALCRRWSRDSNLLHGKFGSEMGQIERSGERIYLQKPLEFMNVSGQAVQRALAFYRIEVDHVLAIHDEIDLPLGRLKVKAGGGHGGHNGLRSISGAIGPDYLRIRCGVGRPQGGKERVVGHVLGPFSKAEQPEAALLVERAADAVEDVLDRGIPYAMNKYNANPEPMS